MHTEDKLRFLQFPTETINMCRKVIATTWKRGIQEERDYGGSVEVKVFGHPWRGASDEAIGARRLICALLGALHGQGWVLTLCTDISKKNWDKDTLIFRHQVPSPAECDWCCIAFSRMDRIKFIDVSPEIYTALISRLGPTQVQGHWPHSQGVYEVKLSGTPWYANGTATMEVRAMLLVLLEILESEGWTVYASVDQKNGTDKQTETDTWHCCRPKGWERGAPVYHN